MEALPVRCLCVRGSTVQSSLSLDLHVRVNDSSEGLLSTINRRLIVCVVTSSELALTAHNRRYNARKILLIGIIRESALISAYNNC